MIWFASDDLPGAVEMARPIKRLEAGPDVVEELRRRLRARTSMVRERERAEIILEKIHRARAALDKAEAA